MRLLPSDPDIATLLLRIKNHDIELQPDFQRGEVWSYSKKQKLIDSILRDWHVPPIHVIQTKYSEVQEVLDGQQRLVAIRDFANGKVKIDGNAEPFDQSILELDGLTYAELPQKFRRRFDQFTIRVFRIIDYKPQEPGELFFRLNQPVGLTTAEQRNAFFGETRHQVRSIVDEMEKIGISKGLLGFSNSRMAYDDVIARVAMTLDGGTLSEKVDSTKLATRYRADIPFGENSANRIRAALAVMSIIRNNSDIKIKFNKATLYSWLLFIIRANDELGPEFDGIVLSAFIRQFELMRDGVLATKGDHQLQKIWTSLVRIYNDRSTSRVGNVSSVIFRDLVLWIAYLGLGFEPKAPVKPNSQVERLKDSIEVLNITSNQDIRFGEGFLETIGEHAHWGEI
jgi:Protein of unknown function DUF262